MNFNRAYQMCPYLLGNSEGVMCRAAIDFIRNVHDIDLEICVGSHFESCYLYYSQIKEINVIPSGKNMNALQTQ